MIWVSNLAAVPWGGHQFCRTFHRRGNWGAGTRQLAGRKELGSELTPAGRPCSSIPLHALYLHWFVFWPHCMACSILVPCQGLNPGALAARVPSPNPQGTPNMLCAVSVYYKPKTLKGKEKTQPKFNCWTFYTTILSSWSVSLFNFYLSCFNASFTPTVSTLLSL